MDQARRRGLAAGTLAGWGLDRVASYGHERDSVLRNEGDAMSDLADKILALKATKQFSDVDLHQMAEVMSYAKPEENYHRLKVLLLAGHPLISREVVLGLVGEGRVCNRPGCGNGPLDEVCLVCRAKDENIASILDPDKLAKEIIEESGVMAERRMKRGSE